MELNWCEVTVKTDQEAVEAVSEIFMECGAGGVAIEDPHAIKDRIARNTWDAFCFPDELVERDFVVVKAYLPCDRKLEERLYQLNQQLDNLKAVFSPEAIKDIEFGNIREEDWANSWKAYYKPVRISERIVIKPTWEEYDRQPDDIVIELDPGMAFGTGTHSTTVMCIRALELILQGGETVFDIGTGSGILSIAAAKLGARQVTAVDIDEVAVKAAKANVAVNGVDGQVEVLGGNLLDSVKGLADVVVANIIADVIIRVCPDAAKVIKPGGKFIASGIIEPRREEVLDAVENNGFIIKRVTQEGDWVCLVAVREV